MANAINKGLDALGKVGDIGFVDFTTKLVSNVYDVVITSEIEQMKAYAQLVKDVSQPLADYQKQVTGITFNDSDMLSAENVPQFDSYIKDVLTITMASAGETTLDDSNKEKTIEHFNGLTITKGTDEEPITTTIDGDNKINNDDLRKFVYQKLAENTKEKYDLLLAVLKLGPKGVEVVNCQIKTALMYDVKANENESSASTNVDTKATNWGVRASASARWGWGKAQVSGGYNSSKVSVRVVNDKSSSAVNLAASIMGSVTIDLKSRSFPGYETTQS